MTLEKKHYNTATVRKEEWNIVWNDQHGFTDSEKWKNRTRLTAHLNEYFMEEQEEYFTSCLGSMMKNLNVKK